MPNFSGVWTLQEQFEAITEGNWTGLPLPELYAWGLATNGRLGLNNTTNQSSPAQIGETADWLELGDGVGNHTLAIKTDNSLLAWGKNSSGQVGDNTTADKSSPVQIGALTNWSKISAGFNHSSAIKTDGTLWAWGDNNDGQLGNGFNLSTDQSSPVQIGLLTNWAQISSGAYFNTAIKTDGTLWAWGQGGSGRLGLNDTNSRSSPVQIGAETDWAQTSSGDDHSAAITSSGELYTWGGDNAGRLGQNTVYVEKSSPTQVGALTNWAQVSCGTDHTIALKTDGTIWAWGDDGEGRLGLNQPDTNTSSPVQIGALTNWSQVSAGSVFSAAVKTDGTLWAWGRNGNGYVGDYSGIDRSSPVQIGASTSWTQVCSNRQHTTAINEARTGMS